MKKVIGMHEVGHVCGLAHVSGCRVMRQDDREFICGAMPTAGGVASVTVYP